MKNQQKMKIVIKILLFTAIISGLFICVFAESIPIWAKDFTGEGGGKIMIREKDSDFALPCIHLWHTKGHSLEWNFSSWPGDFEMVLTYCAQSSTLSEIQVNGTAIKGLGTYQFKDTGGLTKWKEDKLPVKIGLKHGKNTLKITWLDESELFLNSIKLIGLNKEENVIDLKNFIKEEGVNVQVLISNKGGFISMADGTGQWLEWGISSKFFADIYLRYASLNNSKVEIRINGEQIKGLESVELERSGGWKYWIEKKLSVTAKINFKSGKNILRLTNLGSTPVNLNSIILYDPEKSGSQLYAVWFLNQGGGEVTVHKPLEYSTLYGWDNKGHWLEWTIDNKGEEDLKDIPISIRLRYTAMSNAKREFKWNGETINGLETVVFEKTNGWNDWSEQGGQFVLKFKKGKNILRITNIDGNGLNLDSIMLNTR